MNATVLFSIVPLSLLFVLTVALLLAAAEVGSWTSRCCVKVREHDSPVGSMVAALAKFYPFWGLMSGNIKGVDVSIDAEDFPLTPLAGISGLEGLAGKLSGEDRKSVV